MMIHPNFDPIALSIGHLAIRWYALSYIVGFVLFMWLGRRRIKRGNTVFTNEMLDDFLTWGVLGVIIGGRLGYVLFYQPGFYLSHPLEILKVWQGGMAFHGGFIGVLAAMALFARKHKISFLQVADFVAPLVPLGLAAGRMGNFINGELVGRATDVPWAMVFPQVDMLARHPSQLYQFGLEGVLLFLLLWWYAGRTRPLRAVSAMFLIGYGSLRFIAEFFRTPDPGIFGTLTLGLSTAQWLCVPMVVVGGVMLVLAARGARR